MDKKVTLLSSNDDSVNSMPEKNFDSESHGVFDPSQSPTNSSESDNMTLNITTSLRKLVKTGGKEDWNKEKKHLGKRK